MEWSRYIWLSHEVIPVCIPINQFVEGNGQSSEAKEFANLAQLALMDEGEVDLDERIIIQSDFAKDYPCQAGVVMDAVTSCSPLTNLVLAIFEQDNDVNLIFQEENSANPISGNASTSNLINYNSVAKTCNVTTQFSANYLQNGTDLSISRTAIHESIHAILVYMVLEGKFVAQTGNIENGYSEVMNGYVEYLSTNNNSTYSGAQHNIMTELIENIATALSSFGNTSGYNLPFCYYKDMAWGGLTHIKDNNGNPILNPLFLSAVPSLSDRNRIISTLAAETLNTVQNNIQPKGSPCAN